MNPTSDDIERSVLGCFLLDPDALDRSRLQADHLGRPKHAALLGLMRSMRAAGRFDCAEQVYVALSADAELALSVGGLSYASDHASQIGTVEALPYYERLVLEAHHRRSVRAAAEAALGALAEGHDPATVDGDLRQALDAVREVGTDRCERASPVAARVWARQDARLRSGRSAYLPTGWREWDDSEDWQGWSSEGVSYILARSGMGKTSLLNSTAVLMAARGVRVAIHGTETSADARIDTMAYGVAGIDPRRYHWLARLRAEGKSRQGQDEELEKLADAHRCALAWLGTLPLRVSGAGLTVERLSLEVSRLAHAGECEVLIVDYLQDFVVSRGIKPGEKVAQVNHASTALKALSSTLRIPVICGAQVSGEKDGIPRDMFPDTWDIQWSSGAHQDAEEIFAVNRGEYWRDRMGRLYQPDKHGQPNVIDICARKRRSGRLTMLSLPWCGFARWVGAKPAVVNTGAPIPAVLDTDEADDTDRTWQ